MTDFYIHIGMHKTGTSSIQRNFFTHRGYLLDRGINYLNLHQNHSVPFVSLLSAEPHLYFPNIVRGTNTEEKAARRNARTRDALARELRTNRSEKLVISGEDLSILDLEQVERLKAMLQPSAAAFRIIIYVREPYAFMSSDVQQRLKAGETLRPLRRNPPLPQYRRRIENYIQVFGRDRVDIRVFDSDHLVNRDLISDFLVAIGAPAELLDGRDIVRLNESLCHEAALIVDHVNKIVPMLKANARNPDRANLEKWLGQLKGPKFVLGALIDDNVRKLLADDLDWLHKAIGKHVFSLKPKQEAVTSWSEETLQSLARLFNTMGCLIRDNEALLHLREGQIALLVNDLPAAKKSLRVAIRLNPNAAAAHYELSRVHAAAGQPDKAIDAGREALGLEPANAEYRGWLARLEESAATTSDRQAPASVGGPNQPRPRSPPVD